MKIEEAKVGMTVRLKSGGPLMVVAHVNEPLASVSVAWHENGGISRHDFRIEMVFASEPTEAEMRRPAWSSQDWAEYLRSKKPGPSGQR